MQATDLIGDQLYQLNLILWMLQPSTGSVVTPLLAKAGFSLKYIEPELPLPLELRNRLIESEIEVSDPVVPDVVMASDEGVVGLIECKRSMFGYVDNEEGCSSQVKQARTLLLQVPLVLLSALPSLAKADVGAVHALYIAAHDGSAAQSDGLRAIEEHLRDNGYETTSFGLFTLKATLEGVMLCNADTESLPKSLGDVAQGGDVRVHSLASDETDPRPLYIIPWVPGCGDEIDDYGHAAFGNRVLAQVAVQVGPKTTPCDVSIEVEHILSEVTQGYYAQWRNRNVRRHLRRRTKDLIRKVLSEADKNLKVSPLGNPSTGWRLSLPDDSAKNAVLKALRTWQTERWNLVPALGLFDNTDWEE